MFGPAPGVRPTYSLRGAPQLGSAQLQLLPLYIHSVDSPVDGRELETRAEILGLQRWSAADPRDSTPRPILRLSVSMAIAGADVPAPQLSVFFFPPTSQPYVLQVTGSVHSSV